MNHPEINRRPITQEVREKLSDKAREIVDEAFEEIDEYRYRGKIDGWEDKRREIEAAHEQAAGFDQLVIGATLGDLLSITGRWQGSENKLVRGAALVEQYCHHISEFRSQYDRTTLGVARAWLGNTWSRKGYLSGRRDDLSQAVTWLRQAHRSMEKGWELACTMRDLGDAHVGILVFCKDVEITGCSMYELDLALEEFESLSGEPGQEGILAAETAAVRSSRAVGAVYILELLRDEDQPVTPRYWPEESRGKLLQTAQDDVVSVESAYTKYVGSRQGPRPFRWYRTITNAGFASHYLWRLTCADEWVGRADLCFDAGIRGYLPDQHPFRRGVILEGLADLCRDRYLLSGADELKNKAMDSYASAAALFNGAARRRDLCVRKQSWLRRR